jgi:rod shape-determining protein MreB
MFQGLYNTFSNDIGIDLGTANTLVYLRGTGIVINEPSLVALNTKTGRIVAVGQSAKQMLGRTPAHIKSVQPIVDGVISDFEVTEEMLSYLITKTESFSKKFFGPRVVIGVPSGITSVEHRAVYDAAKSAGAREVYIIEEPMAAAIGIGLPVREPVGNMIIDIGGGTTDIAVIALSGIVGAKSVKIAGDRMNQDIINYVRNEFRMLIGEKTAEDIKINLGSALGAKGERMQIKGRDMATGLPREITILDKHVSEALEKTIAQITDAVRVVLETTPPEVLSDVMKNGAFISGGGALIDGIGQYMSAVFDIPFNIPDDPLSAVARGCGIVLENLDDYSEIILLDHDIHTPKNSLI